MNHVKFITRAAAIAAIYIGITAIFAPISFGHDVFQLRVSEALTVLPVFTPAAVPGLFLGCLLSNLIFGGLGPIDLIFGSLTTLCAAWCTYALRKKNRLVALIPPVVLNALVVGTYLKFLLFSDFANISVWTTILYTGLGQLGACYLLGYPLSLALDKVKGRLF